MTANGSRPALDVKKVLVGAQLPALPQSAICLLELSQDPANGPAEFASAIEADPGLTGQVLRFVNSSYFGFSREISSVKMAITMVGVRTIKNFALWSAVFSLMPNPKCGPFTLKALWQDSLRRALFARAVGHLLGMKEAEETFAAALLQDMAVPILAKEAPAVYTRLLQARNQGKVRLSALETQVFGWTHAEAAGLMARQWKLPEEFAVAIETHHLLPDQTDGVLKGDPAKMSVAISSLLPVVNDPLWVECRRCESAYQRMVPPGSPSLPELLEQVDHEFDQFAPVLKLSSPAKSLVDSYHEVTAVAAC